VYCAYTGDVKFSYSVGGGVAEGNFEAYGANVASFVWGKLYFSRQSKGNNKCGRVEDVLSVPPLRGSKRSGATLGFHSYPASPQAKVCRHYVADRRLVSRSHAPLGNEFNVRR